MNITPEQIQEYLNRFTKQNSSVPLSKASKGVYKSYLKDLATSGDLQYFFEPDVFLDRLLKRRPSQQTHRNMVIVAMKLIEVMDSEELLHHFPIQNLSFAEGKNVIMRYKKALAEDKITKPQAKEPLMTVT